jgi:hypothetical protein
MYETWQQLQHVRLLVESRNGQQVCTMLLRMVAAAACCTVSLLLPLLLSVCDMVLVQDLCVHSQQLQQQLRSCGISQQLTTWHLNIHTSCDLLPIYVVDKLG